MSVESSEHAYRSRRSSSYYANFNGLRRGENENTEHVHRLLTMHFGPHEVLLTLETLEAKFRDDLSAVGVRKAVARLDENVRTKYPDITRIFFGSETVAHNRTED